MPRGALAVVWDLAAVINVDWWRAHGARIWAAAGIQVRMTGPGRRSGHFATVTHRNPQSEREPPLCAPASVCWESANAAPNRAICAVTRTAVTVARCRLCRKEGVSHRGRLTKRGGTGHQPWAHWPARLGYWRPPGRRRLPAVPRAVDLPGGDVPVGRG